MSECGKSGGENLPIPYDFLGNEIKVGYELVYSVRHDSTHQLKKGWVIETGTYKERIYSWQTPPIPVAKVKVRVLKEWGHGRGPDPEYYETWIHALDRTVVVGKVPPLPRIDQED